MTYNLTQTQELIVIHEFMHQLGLIGPDNASQSYTLANGQKVTGSQVCLRPCATTVSRSEEQYVGTTIVDDPSDWRAGYAGSSVLDLRHNRPAGRPAAAPRHLE